MSRPDAGQLSFLYILKDERFELTPWLQIKYTELPNFSEVMAAGTAAALVPIRSITRRIAPSSAQSLKQSAEKHERVSFQNDEETITYIPDSEEDAGPLCIKLLTQLKGIQLGKVEDAFGWSVAVSEEDGKGIEGAPSKAKHTNGHTVDQLD